MKDYYKRWGEQECVDVFAEKDTGSFFDSERHFLEEIATDISSVLDIGCGSGHFIKLLKTFIPSFTYTGVDIIPQNIENARRFYPDARFVLGNGLDFRDDRTYDLVNATGVCQHEPLFEELVSNMYTLSNRYVLFDVKIADIKEHVIDRDRAYCRGEHHRLYFIILNLSRLQAYLKSLPQLSQLIIYGYETKPNRRTVIPESIHTLISASVLLEKDAGSLPGKDGPEVSVHIPGFPMS